VNMSYPQFEQLKRRYADEVPFGTWTAGGGVGMGVGVGASFSFSGVVAGSASSGMVANFLRTCFNAGRRMGLLI
jgi:hypothetical protein